MAVMARYPDKHFSLACVDPPYGIQQDSCRVKSRGKLAPTTNWGNFDWDRQPPPVEYFKELMRVSENQIVFGANHFINKMAFDSPCWIVWDKDNGDSHYADCELAWSSFKTAVRKFKHRWNGMLQANMAEKEKRIHPTQKPVALYSWLLANYAQPGDRIFDSHGGSLSSVIACVRHGFSITCCELDPDYFKAGVERVQREMDQFVLDLPNCPVASEVDLFQSADANIPSPDTQAALI